MTTPDLWSGQDRMLTVEDMASRPDDEFRYELDDGLPVAFPAPSRLHQLAVTRLAVLLDAACPPGLIVLAGVGVNISRFQHRVPDIAVVAAGSFGTVFQEEPPALVAEVASPRTKLYDRNRKKDVYQSFGIPSYWIVDPDRAHPSLTVFELRAGTYTEIATVTGDDGYEAKQPFPVTVVPSRLLAIH